MDSISDASLFSNDYIPVTDATTATTMITPTDFTSSVHSMVVSSKGAHIGSQQGILVTKEKAANCEMKESALHNILKKEIKELISKQTLSSREVWENIYIDTKKDLCIILWLRLMYSEWYTISSMYSNSNGIGS